MVACNRLDSLVEMGFLELTRRNERGFDASSPLRLANGVTVRLLDTGVLLAEPGAFDPGRPVAAALVLSSGIHGNETAPIEIVEQISQSILSGEVVVRNPTLLIIGNPLAMNLGRRFEIENMNRLFCGNYRGREHYEARRAEQLQHLVRKFYVSHPAVQRFHYDLHTAIRASEYKKFAIYPFLDGRPWDKDQIEFFLASDINTILFGHQPASTFSYFCSHEFKAHAFTVELGKVRPFGQNDMSEFAAIQKNLTSLIAGHPVHTAPVPPARTHLFRVKHELLRRSEDRFKLNVADDVANFTTFPKGYVLTEDIDGGYTVTEDGEAIVFPNAKVPVGQRAGLVVVRTSI